MSLSRRAFGWGIAGAVGAGWLGFRIADGQGISQTSARPNVGAIDHDRMVRLGDAALGRKPVALTSVRAGGSPGGMHDYFSDEGFRGHRDLLRGMCVDVAALAGAWGVTKDTKYVEAAIAWLRMWCVTPATRMTPRLEYAQYRTKFSDPKQAASGTPEGVIEGVFLAEMAMAVPFLAASEAVTDADLAGIKAWLAEYLNWLTAPEDAGPRIAALARDLQNHHGSSWLLQAAALAKVTGNDAVMSDCRHRFERVTLRAQVVALGNYPAELVTANPYRDSLMNLDMLAGACELVSTSFESVWEYELQDGPGMRASIAYFFPLIQNKAAWPLPADKEHFADLPLRRPALLFAARAYTRGEYVDLWKTLPADPPANADHGIEESFVIRQPCLWVTRPPRRVV